MFIEALKGLHYTSSVFPPSTFFHVASLFPSSSCYAGNIFAFGLFVSSMPTFRRIMRNKSTEQFSGLPYIYALLNCLICLWYGAPFISNSSVMLMTVNSVGATFQLCYIIIFIMHTDKKNKMNMLGLLLVVFHVVG